VIRVTARSGAALYFLGMRTSTRDTDANLETVGAQAAVRSAQLQELELIELMLCGHDRAWRQFILRYRPLIIATTHRIAQNFRGRYTVEDDEIFCALMGALLANDMQKLRAFDPMKGLKFSNWIGRLTANLTWDTLREARRRSALGESYRQLNRGAYETDIGARVICREEFARLVRAREALSTTDRRFFDMFYMDCADAADIATALRISLKTVYTKNHKVRMKLRSALEREPDPKN
jgi:RNA polymerase sigma-70 factor (ECF subfamily)